MILVEFGRFKEFYSNNIELCMIVVMIRFKGGRVGFGVGVVVGGGVVVVIIFEN